MFGSDTHPTPLWDHPDFDHIGWASQVDLEDANHEVYRRPEESPHYSLSEDDWRPVFRKKGGHGDVVVHHDPDVGSIFAHYPHDKNLRPMLWTVADNPDGTDIDIMSSSGGGNWQTFHDKGAPGKSTPAVIKEVGGIVKIHHPDKVFKGTRVTGAASKNPASSTREFDFSRFSAEDVERYYIEVYGDDYRIYHRPPRPEHGAPLHDLTQVYPDDVYTHPHYYHGQRPASASDREATSAFMAARGNPDHTVKIYRAVPKHVTDINPGDWITTSPSYARIHAGNKSEGFHVLEATARAGDLHTDGNSLAEYGYNGTSAIKGRRIR